LHLTGRGLFDNARTVDLLIVQLFARALGIDGIGERSDANPV
jgi:hypothetical protein